MKNKKLSVWIFIAVTILCGWFGLLIDSVLSAQQEGGSLGLLIWLVFPLLSVIVLRTRNKDWKNNGLKLHFCKNIKWYVVAFAINIVVAGICVVIGLLSGTMSFRGPQPEQLVELIVAAIAMQLIKNVFEEFAWRGYLTQKLTDTKLSDVWIYLIVGLVWSMWHVPYYLFYLDSELVGDSTRYGLVASSFIILLLWSIMYVEMYRITRSIWPCVIMHATSNVIQSIFIDTDNGLVFQSKVSELILNPASGILAMGLFVIFGLGLRTYRKQYCKND